MEHCNALSTESQRGLKIFLDFIKIIFFRHFLFRGADIFDYETGVEISIIVFIIVKVIRRVIATYSFTPLFTQILKTYV